MKKLPISKKVLEYALVSISVDKSFPVGWGGWWKTNYNVSPGPKPLDNDLTLTGQDLVRGHRPDLELDNCIEIA